MFNLPPLMPRLVHWPRHLLTLHVFRQSQDVRQSLHQLTGAAHNVPAGVWSAGFRVAGVALALLCAMLPGVGTAADGPTVKQALGIQPVQKDVEIETPTTPEDLAKCQLQLERGKNGGWNVTGASGQTLRRFLDTNGDRAIDEWRYYNLGVEVYRDVDSNFNKKVDQSRWLNLGGTKWGVDTNEDGKLDVWKIISAAEVSRAAVQATLNTDSAALLALMVTAEDLKTVGLEASLAAKLLEGRDDLDQKLRKAVQGSKTLVPGATWMRFDAQVPCLIPADEGKARIDLQVYENAMAIVDVKGQSALVQLGEMIRIGDAWRLTRVPEAIESTAVQVTAGGLLLQPLLASVSNPGGAPVTTAEAQKLLTELQELDQKAPTSSATRDQLATYNSRRAELLMQLMKLAEAPEERDQWARQLVDGLVASIQTGAYPDGLERLRKVEEELKQVSSTGQTMAYIVYRRLLADYTVAMAQPEAEKQAEAQRLWLKGLETFIELYPEAEDGSEAMLQLGMNEEFSGRNKEAEGWYRKLATTNPKSRAGQRAVGALRRFELKGQPLALSGPSTAGGTLNLQSYRGRIVLVAFWATWCQPYTADLPELRALSQQYRAKGFEVVGVNLDVAADPIAAYTTENKIPWPSIHTPGGLEDNPVALQYGIMSLPTMFLVDREGQVISRASSVAELKMLLPTLLK